MSMENVLSRLIKRDKNTIFELANRNIKTQYRGSVLGFLWTILNPLLTMLIMWLVFDKIFGRSPYYPIYLLCGNIMFSALRASTAGALTSIQNNRSLLLRTKVNPYVFPCAVSISTMINFFLSLIALIPFMIWLSVTQAQNLFTYRLLFILFMLPAFWLFEFGLGMLLSVLYIFFKDIKHLYHVFLILWQYLTPIFYTIDRFEGNDVGPIVTIIRCNPMYHFVTYLRECTYMGAVGIDPMFPNDTFKIAEYIPQWGTLGILYICGIGSAIIGIVVYKLLKDKAVLKL